MRARNPTLVRVCFLIWMVTAWLGLAIAVLLFVLAAAQLAFPAIKVFDADSGDLLASLGFFALTGGLCVWLIRFGRRLFRPLLGEPVGRSSNKPGQ